MTMGIEIASFKNESKLCCRTNSCSSVVVMAGPGQSRNCLIHIYHMRDGEEGRKGGREERETWLGMCCCG